MHKLTLESINQLNNLVEIGNQSETIVINYADTLITAMNPRVNPKPNEVPIPHPCSIDYKNLPLDQRDEFYESLINCCQRHVCKPETGYCLKGNSDKCRFKYPFELNETTRLEFIETGSTVKANLVLKRNDPYMNCHCRICSENWCSNIDMQLILDQAAAIAYMVKYATKAEKAGSSLNDLYKSVIMYANEDDNTITKLRSLMLKTVSGKRDLGQCEVCRLLMSEPLYSSSFEYVQQSLDLNQAKELNNLNKNGNNKATNSTLMDYYAHRFQNEQLSPILETISSFYDFVIKYKVIKGQLTPRKNNKEIIIVTYPKVRYNTKIIENI